VIQEALATMDQRYLAQLADTEWLPGKNAIFNAFSQPIDRVEYVLFGESPYPRKISANGYAFYDAAVSDLWTNSGLSKPVNRATSLRNLIKMLLLADDLLTPDDLSQEAISKVNKTSLIQTNHELFHKLSTKGFLLLNASLVLQVQSPEKDAKAWQPFLLHIVQTLIKHSPTIKWLLFGRIAKNIAPFLRNVNDEQIIISEHPYNLSFIQQPIILETFKPLNLLRL
jgi:uracil-DNA glycosylase